MTANNKCFIDTNIIVYANDAQNIAKQKKALEIISDLMQTGTGVISTQVLQEYANVALNKLKQNHDVILRQLVLLERLEVIEQTPALIRRAVEIQISYKISFWDSCIISTAEYANCDSIITEDLNEKQFYSGISIINPF